MLSVKNRIVLSLTVFSMFFGAGNLIFPPFLGYEAGFSFFPAFLGFAITAIGLPVLALLAVGLFSRLYTQSRFIYQLVHALQFRVQQAQASRW